MALCLTCKTPGCDSVRCTGAAELHNRLLPLQKQALWYLSRFMSSQELQCIAEDFLMAIDAPKNQVHPQSLADMIDFWYTR